MDHFKTRPLASAIRYLLLSAAVGTYAATSVAQDADERRLLVSPIHYDLTLDVDYEAERLSGQVELTIRNWSEQETSVVPLILYRLMSISSVVGADDEPLEFAQDVVAFEDFGQLQVNRIEIRLPKALRPGDTTSIRIDYSGFLLGYSETGMLYVQDRIDPEFSIFRDDGIAFPRIAYTSWLANRRTPLPAYSYQATITVPEQFTVANGGQLVEHRIENGRAAWMYRSYRPSWRMDFAVARYRQLEEGPIRIFYLPGDSTGAAGVQRAARESLNLFTAWFGPLQETSHLTILEIPDGWGSQADVTTIIQAAGAFRDSTRNYEVYHEVSHLWNPASTDLPSPRWNEGLASFLQSLATEHINHIASVDRRANALIGQLRDNVASKPEWREAPMTEYGTAMMTDLSYSVGALFFTLLYRQVGAERFNDIVGTYYADYWASGGSTEDFLHVARRLGGADVDPLLQDWVLTTRWVDLVTTIETVSDLSDQYR